jgi:protein SCO1
VTARAVRLIVSACVFVVTLVVAGDAHAQMTGAPAAGYRREPGMAASVVPRPLREIGFDQRLDERVPLDVEFKDDQGRTVKLGEYFGRKPVVLAFVYYDCPMLCTMVLSSITSTLGVLSLDAGKDFELVMVSFDPRETPELAARKKAEYVHRYDRPTAASGWHFLTGEPPSIERLTKAAGFRYAWDDETQQFAHPAGIVVLTPDGRLARYLFGLEYGPRDLRFALVEASEGRIGTPIDAALLYCFHYDPMTGRYGFVVMRALRIAGAATVVAIGTFVLVMLRRERKMRGRIPAAQHPAGSAEHPLGAAQHSTGATPHFRRSSD